MNNIKNQVNNFLESRDKNHRYSSFDYCYNYFYNFYKNDKINEIWNDNNIEKSCLHLWFYLASWWMMRGSSFLLQKNLSIFKNLIQEISRKDSKIYWDIDIDNYNDENIERLLELKNIIYESFPENKPSDTLITKIMLWIFWNIPAFDRFFKDWIKIISKNKISITSVDKISLNIIKDFYLKNKNVIDKFEIKTLDFQNLNYTNIKYTKAKVIDMYWFMTWYNNYLQLKNAKPTKNPPR